MQNPLYGNYQNAIEAAGQRGAAEAEKVASRIVAEESLQLVRAEVVAVDTQNRVQIRRLHNEEPDPPFYQLLSPAVIPSVGQEVFGAAGGGSLMLMGSEPGAGYVDINGVRGGNLFDNVIDARVIGVDAVGTSEIATDAVGDYEIRNRSVNNYNLAYDSVTGHEVADRQLGNLNIALDTLGQGEVQDYALGDQSFSTDSVGHRTVQERSLYGYNQLVLRTVNTGEISYDAVRSEEVAPNSLHSGNITDYTIGDRSMATDSVGARVVGEGSLGSGQLSDTLNNPGHNNYGLRSLYGGTSNSAAGGSHKHQNHDTVPYWLIELSMDERDEWLDTKHRVEAIDTSVPLQGEGLDDLIALVSHTHHMLTSNSHFGAEELQERLRNDIDYRHEFLMDQDENYYARWWATFDPAYRVRNADNPFVQHALEECVSITQKHQEYAGRDRVMALTDDWIEEKLAEWPCEDYGVTQLHHANEW